MTRKKYEKTRKNPLRDGATTKGKELVKEFMKTIDDRKSVECTAKERKLYEDKDNKISDAIGLFVKYLSEDLGHKYNKGVFIFVVDDEDKTTQPESLSTIAMFPFNLGISAHSQTLEPCGKNFSKGVTASGGV